MIPNSTEIYHIRPKSPQGWGTFPAEQKDTVSQESFIGRVLSHSMVLLNAADSPQRLGRIITRAAAAITGGQCLMFVFDNKTQTLEPYIFIEDPVDEQTAFSGSLSGLFSLPQLNSLKLQEGFAGIACARREIIFAQNTEYTGQFPPETMEIEKKLFPRPPAAALAVPLLADEQILGALEVVFAAPAVDFSPMKYESVQSLAYFAALKLQSFRNTPAPDLPQLFALEMARKEAVSQFIVLRPKREMETLLRCVQSADVAAETDIWQARNEIRRMYQKLEDLGRSLNEISSLMIGATPEQYGLQQSLELYVEYLNQHTTFDCTLDYQCAAVLSADITRALFIIITEAAENAVKHSQGSACAVEVSKHNRILRAAVKDNGAGFDTEAMPERFQRGELPGMYRMYRNAEQIRGELQIISNPAGGSMVEVKVLLD